MIKYNNFIYFQKNYIKIMKTKKKFLNLVKCLFKRKLNIVFKKNKKIRFKKKSIL